MPSKERCSNSFFRTSSRAATSALAIAVVFVLTLMSQSADAQTFQVIYSFGTSDSDGYAPNGIVMDSAGYLYGTTMDGGLSGYGTVFRLSNQGSGRLYTTLYSFTGAEHGDGRAPDFGVTFGPDGGLYGTTYYGGVQHGCEGAGCGTVYKLTPPAWTESVLYRFGRGSTPFDGGYAFGGLVFDEAGNLYGNTLVGYNGSGTVFSLRPSGGRWIERILAYSGCCGRGRGIVIDNAGNLYAISPSGAYGYGAVFELMPSGSGWTEKVLYNFQGGSDGGFPSNSLILDQSGNLYGMTTGWFGSGGSGTVFELTPSGGTWTFSLLYSLTGGPSNGAQTGLVIDTEGNLYGTQYYYGQNGGSGSVFRLSPSSSGWAYTDLHDFNAASDGNNPETLILGADGNLYGVTFSGGINSGGTLFEITP
jgi:uncharacterized repeat protein (TIGR03803 family)